MAWMWGFKILLLMSWSCKKLHGKLHGLTAYAQISYRGRYKKKTNKNKKQKKTQNLEFFASICSSPPRSTFISCISRPQKAKELSRNHFLALLHDKVKVSSLSKQGPLSRSLDLTRDPSTRLYDGQITPLTGRCDILKIVVQKVLWTHTFHAFSSHCHNKTRPPVGSQQVICDAICKNLSDVSKMQNWLFGLNFKFSSFQNCLNFVSRTTTSKVIIKWCWVVLYCY